jgi:DNA-binding NarL/FixJ family response regulator
MLETRGYRVLACNTAAEAINIMARGAVDLVLSNGDLPHAPSPELVRGVKSISPETPIVLLSAHKWAYHAEAFAGEAAWSSTGRIGSIGGRMPPSCLLAESSKAHRGQTWLQLLV